MDKFLMIKDEETGKNYIQGALELLGYKKKEERMNYVEQVSILIKQRDIRRRTKVKVKE